MIMKEFHPYTFTRFFHRFAVDSLNSYVNALSRTTVGVPIARRLTDNRKFFANLLASNELQEMLDKDVKKLRKSLVEKLKFCDTVTMTKANLKDFYEREPGE